jgi:SAM-dependent MidA family methyltransferase
MITHQQSILATGSYRNTVDWEEELPRNVNGCILSNELLDSFAVHRIRITDGSLREIFVHWSGGAFVEELRPLVSNEVSTYFERLDLLPGEGCTAEVNLQALYWMRESGKALRRGFVMTFDYGHQASDLFAPWRTDGTLMCFYRHNPSSDPYARIGRQDMTTHIDFTSLITAGEDAGLTTAGLTSQSEFLERLGIQDALAPPSEGIDLEAYYARRGQINELIDPAGLGRIRVLVQSKAADGARLSGFHGGTDA